MKYNITCYADLEIARKTAHRRTEKYRSRIQKNIRGMKESFTPLGIISNVTGIFRGPNLSWPVLALALIRKAKKAIQSR